MKLTELGRDVTLPELRLNVVSDVVAQTHRFKVYRDVNNLEDNNEQSERNNSDLWEIDLPGLSRDDTQSEPLRGRGNDREDISEQCKQNYSDLWEIELPRISRDVTSQQSEASDVNSNVYTRSDLKDKSKHCKQTDSDLFDRDRRDLTIQLPSDKNSDVYSNCYMNNHLEDNSKHCKPDSDLFQINLPKVLSDNYTQTDFSDYMRNKEVRSELFWNDVKFVNRGCNASDASVGTSQVTVMAAANKEVASGDKLDSTPPKSIPSENHFYENIEDLKFNTSNLDNSNGSCEYQRYADPYNIGLVFPAEMETDDELLNNYIDGNIYGTDRDMLRRFIQSVNQDPKHEAIEKPQPKDIKVKEALDRQKIYRRNAELSKNAELLKNVQFNLDLLDANINYELEKIQALVESEAAEVKNANTIRYSASAAGEEDTDSEKPSIDSSSNTTDDASSKSLALEDSMGSLVQYLTSSEDTLSGNSAGHNETDNREQNSGHLQSSQAQRENKKKLDVKTKQSCIVV